MKKLSLLVSISVSFFLFAETHAQCSMYPLALETRVINSSMIVEGKVISSESFWNSEHSMIYTATQIELYKVFRGTSPADAITIITEGGEVENEKVVVSPGVEFDQGDAGIFCLNKTSGFDNLSSAHQYILQGAAQGFIKYDLESKTAHDPFNSYPDIESQLYNSVLQYSGNNSYQLVKEADLFSIKNNKNPMAVPTITSFTPTSTYAGKLGAVVLTITGTNFGSSYVSGTSNLQFKNANDGGATYITTPSNHIISWSSTSITAWIPTGACSGTIKVTNSTNETGTSTTSITINYNEINVISGSNYYLPDLVSDNGSGGYTLVYNTTFNSNTSAVAAFERALGTWRCGTFVNFARSGTTSIATNASDGTNVVTFDGSSALPSGVLATAYNYYSTCATGVWYLSEIDVKIKTNGTDGVTWNYGPDATSGSLYDFETVVLHELGHAQQLGHTNLTPVSVMHYSISNGTDRRTLTTTSEVDGGSDVVSRSGTNNSCGPSKLIALTSSNCSLVSLPDANFSASATSICTDAAISFTDLSTNTPTSWSWTFTGGAPSSSTSQNPTGITYATAGTYSVTLVATNAAGSDTETKTNYITVTASPTVSQATITAGGPTSFCGSGSVVLSVAGSGLTYQWLKNAKNISGQTNQTYTAKATATFTCLVSNNCSSLTSNAIDVTKNSNPSSTVTQSPCSGGAVLLTCTPSPTTGVTFQWKKGSNTLAGATNATYSATSDGTYKCTVTITATGCTKTSTGSVVTITCKSLDEVSNRGIYVYPNPSADYFSIDAKSDFENLAVTIFDITGKKIEHYEVINEGSHIGKLLPSGIYFARIENNGELKEVIKLIKNR